MATYSNNTTIKFVTTIALSTNASTVSYTVPAGHFAIIGAASIVYGGVSVGSGHVTVGGVTILRSALTEQIHAGDMHLSEGSTVACNGGHSTNTATVVGSVFKNTP